MTQRRPRRQGRPGTLIAKLGGTLRELGALDALLAAWVGRDRGIRPRRRLDGELEEPVEEQAAGERLPTVEPEGELVEVGEQVSRRTGRAVMCGLSRG